MINESQYDREERDIIRRHSEGLITGKQADEELRELQRDYRDAAHEAAQRAYDREIEGW